MRQRRNEILLRGIAEVLKDLRHKKGVSQQDVFNDTNIHVGRIETAEANLSVSTLSDLCKYFGIKQSAFHERVEKQIREV